jgi:hypothetical protein
MTQEKTILGQVRIFSKQNATSDHEPTRTLGVETQSGMHCAFKTFRADT